MTQPCQSACSPWVEPETVQTCCSEAIDAYVLDEVIGVATDLLFELSGHRFPGSCLDTVRPCAQSVGSSEFRWYNYIGSNWYSGCSCNNGPRCGCSRQSVVQLGGYPITGIVEVKVADDSNPAYDGTQDSSVLDPSLYRVDDWQYLVRLPNPDGSTPGWPCCQNLNAASGDEGSFEVSYSYGLAPPPAGKRAAAELACQLYLACIGSDECQLPSNAQSLTRQGVSILLLNPGDFFRGGFTGLHLVDLFIATYNSSRGRGPARISTPDIPRHIRRAGT